jgi:hypothetical protein
MKQAASKALFCWLTCSSETSVDFHQITASKPSKQAVSWVHLLPAWFFFFYCFAYILILKNEATCSFEWSVGFQRTTQGYNTEARYKGESVNRSQTDIKHKTRDIRTWGGGGHTFLDISSTNIDAFVPSFYLSVEARSLLAAVSATFAPSFEPLRHQQNLCNQGVFLRAKQMEEFRGQVRAVRRMFRKFPL